MIKNKIHNYFYFIRCLCKCVNDTYNNYYCLEYLRLQFYYILLKITDNFLVFRCANPLLRGRDTRTGYYSSDYRNNYSHCIRGESVGITINICGTLI